MEILHFNINDLPDSFKNIIVPKDDDFTEIRSSGKCLNDIDAWISEFSKKTKTSCYDRSSKPHETIFLMILKPQQQTLKHFLFKFVF